MPAVQTPTPLPTLSCIAWPSCECDKLVILSRLAYLTRREEERAIVWLLCWCGGVVGCSCTHSANMYTLSARPGTETLGSFRVACKASSSTYQVKLTIFLVIWVLGDCSYSQNLVKSSQLSATAARIYIFIGLRRKVMVT